MNIQEASTGFSAAGSEPRLAVLLLLVRSGPGGLPFGELQKKLNIPPSTLSHHLRHLVNGGLVNQQSLGRQVISRADFNRIQELAGYLMNECCADQLAACDRLPDPRDGIPN